MPRILVPSGEGRCSLVRGSTGITCGMPSGAAPKLAIRDLA